ncbi:MAG: dihydropteroate synthase [Candidatus Gastranaerophilales bacterium]|nr:dihydropteroate synthase [Candidatus Gastranaerophilales bacterium]
MSEKFYIRKITDNNAEQVIKDIGFDKNYINKAILKYNYILLKIHNLTCPQASILKQLALSVGADVAVHREVITCKTDKTDVLLECTHSQLKILCEKLKFQPFKLSKLSSLLLDQIIKKPASMKIRDTVFDWNKKTYIMGILNITPDSFSDGGKFIDPDNALKQAEKLIEDGADIIDIGGESTRPFSMEVSPEEEIERVIPVIKKIRELNSSIPISIDTRHAIVAKQAIENGADIINDVSGLKWDLEMGKVAAEFNVPVIIMHSISNPEDMQINPEYSENIIDALSKDLYDITQKATEVGIKPENIIIDPGIGFGKTLEHNLEIIRRINEFKSLGFPVLVGVSRKSVIANILNLPPEEREEANIALGSYLASNGADIIRVHDVKKHFKAFKVLDSVIR